MIDKTYLSPIVGAGLAVLTGYSALTGDITMSMGFLSGTMLFCGFLVGQTTAENRMLKNIRDDDIRAMREMIQEAEPMPSPEEIAIAKSIMEKVARTKNPHVEDRPLYVPEKKTREKKEKPPKFGS